MYPAWIFDPTAINVDSLVLRAFGLASFANHDLPALGLDVNTIYSVPEVNDGQGSIPVDAYAINVTCGYSQHTDLIASKDGGYRIRFHTDFDIGQVGV
jgi:hypothetical protein